MFEDDEFTPEQWKAYTVGQSSAKFTMFLKGLVEREDVKIPEECMMIIHHNMTVLLKKTYEIAEMLTKQELKKEVASKEG